MGIRKNRLVHPQFMFGAKIRKKYEEFFSPKRFQFLQEKKTVYITWACIRNIPVHNFLGNRNHLKGYHLDKGKLIGPTF